MAVLLHHLSRLVLAKDHFDFFDSALHFGYLGVDFFFVLSGFIIYHIHAKDIGQPQKITPYLLKRFIRLYSIFWVVMIPVMSIVIILPSFDFGGVDKSLGGIISTL